jgi:cyclase
MSAAHVHGSSQLPPPTIQEVSDGIYAYLQPDGSWGLNNAGFIVGRNSVTVIDTCFTEARTKAFLEAVHTVTTLPLRTLLNTHHHGDHTHGNYLLPGATIIAHRLCREMVIETGLRTLHPLFPTVEWGNLELAPPVVTFEDRLDVYVDDLRVELIFVGPAHTTNDILVWVPERSVLYSGDLLFNQGTPFVAMGSIAGSLRALETLRGLGAKTIVPGHGPVCGLEVVDDMVAYLRFVQELARESFGANMPPLEAARQADLGRFAGWHDTERLAGNMHRAFSEIKGQPLGTGLDLGPIVSDMIAYNGGQPVRCLA